MRNKYSVVELGFDFPRQIVYTCNTKKKAVYVANKAKRYGVSIEVRSPSGKLVWADGSDV